MEEELLGGWVGGWVGGDSYQVGQSMFQLEAAAESRPKAVVARFCLGGWVGGGGELITCDGVEGWVGWLSSLLYCGGGEGGWVGGWGRGYLDALEAGGDEGVQLNVGGGHPYCWGGEVGGWVGGWVSEMGWKQEEMKGGGGGGHPYKRKKKNRKRKRKRWASFLLVHIDRYTANGFSGWLGGWVGGWVG